MKTSIAKLSSIGGAPTGLPLAPATKRILDVSDSLGLLDLLRVKNGFYAFEGALHVLPLTAPPGKPTVESWNASSAWRADYQGLADGCIFFAEDVFGGQFCLYDGCVMSFDPETGDKEFVAAHVEEWASRILADYDVLTGHVLAREWQELHGSIPLGERLNPKVPFVLGGELTVSNLFSLDAGKGMRARANLAIQIRDLPDGAQVVYKVID